MDEGAGGKLAPFMIINKKHYVMKILIGFLSIICYLLIGIIIFKIITKAIDKNKNKLDPDWDYSMLGIGIIFWPIYLLILILWGIWMLFELSLKKIFKSK